MHIEVFETANTKGDLRRLQDLLAQDGKTINVDKIYTAAAGTENYSRHFVTVVYLTLEQPPQ